MFFQDFFSQILQIDMFDMWILTSIDFIHLSRTFEVRITRSSFHKHTVYCFNSIGCEIVYKPSNFSFFPFRIDFIQRLHLWVPLFILLEIMMVLISWSRMQIRLSSTALKGTRENQRGRTSNRKSSLRIPICNQRAFGRNRF